MEKRMEISILFGKISILFFYQKLWIKAKTNRRMEKKMEISVLLEISEILAEKQESLGECRKEWRFPFFSPFSGFSAKISTKKIEWRFSKFFSILFFKEAFSSPFWRKISVFYLKKSWKTLLKKKEWRRIWRISILFFWWRFWQKNRRMEKRMEISILSEKISILFLSRNFGNFRWKTQISRRMEKRMEISILFEKISILFFGRKFRKFWMKTKIIRRMEKRMEISILFEKNSIFFEQKFRKIEMKNTNQPENGEKNGDLHSFWENQQTIRKI